MVRSGSSAVEGVAAEGVQVEVSAARVCRWDDAFAGQLTFHAVRVRGIAAIELPAFDDVAPHVLIDIQ